MVGCPFEAVEPLVDEGVDGTGPGGLDPGSLVEAVARRKAEAVAARFPGRLVVGADTVVVLDGQVMGKPAVPEDAVRMIQQLSGR